MHHLTPDVVTATTHSHGKGCILPNALLQASVPNFIDFVKTCLQSWEYDYVKRGLEWLVNLEAWEKLQQHAVQNAKVHRCDRGSCRRPCRRYAVERRKFFASATSQTCIDSAVDSHPTIRQSSFTSVFWNTSFRRGTDQLVRTAPGIRSIMPDYEVIIVGYNKREQAALENLVKAHNCESYVHLLGFQPELDLPKYMSRSNIGFPHSSETITTRTNKLFGHAWRAALVGFGLHSQANLVTTRFGSRVW